MRKFISMLLIMLCIVMLAPTGRAEEITSSDTYSTGAFEPCEYIPSFAQVPDFYVPVENVTCMYMFVDVNGVPHKRWYGSVDGAYGWYAVEDGEQTVKPYSLPVNVEDDRAMLYMKIDGEYSSASDLGYVGILPPETEQTEVNSIFGVPLREFLLWAVSLVAVLCVAIMLSAAAVKNRRKRQFRL